MPKKQAVKFIPVYRMDEEVEYTIPPIDDDSAWAYDPMSGQSFGDQDFWKTYGKVIGGTGIGVIFRPVEGRDVNVYGICGDPKCSTLGTAANSEHGSKCSLDESWEIYLVAIPITKAVKDEMEVIHESLPDDTDTKKDRKEDLKPGVHEDYIINKGTPEEKKFEFVVVVSMMRPLLGRPITDPFKYSVGEWVRVADFMRFPDELRRANGLPYAKRFGVVLSRERKESLKVDRASWEQHGMSEVFYKVQLEEVCDVCRGKLMTSPKKMRCLNTACERCNVDYERTTSFWQHELDGPFTLDTIADIKSGERKKLIIGIEAMPKTSLPPEKEAEIDSMIVRPVSEVAGVDIDLDSAFDADIYFYKLVVRGSDDIDYKLVNRFVRKFSGKASDLLNGLFAEHNSGPFVQQETVGSKRVDSCRMDVRCLAALVYKGVNYQYEHTLGGMVPLSSDMFKPLTLPSWRSTDGVCVTYHSTYDGQRVKMFPLLSPDEQDLPFFVSDFLDRSFYTFKDATAHTYVMRTKEVKFSGRLYGAGDGPDRDTGLFLFTGSQKDALVWVRFELSVDGGQSKEYELVWSSANASSARIFAKRSFALGNAYLPVEQVLLQGYKTLMRFPREPPAQLPAQQRLAYFNVVMLGGVGPRINSRVFKEGGRLVDTMRDEIKTGTDLRNGDRFIGMCYAMDDGTESPDGRNLYFSRMTTDKEVFNAKTAPALKYKDKPVAVGDFEKLEVATRDVSTDADKGYHVSSFKAIRGAAARTYTSIVGPGRVANFSWAVIGDAVPPPNTAAVVMKGGEKLRGKFWNVSIYAKKVEVAGELDDGKKPAPFVFEAVEHPAEGQFDEILVYFDSKGIINSVLLGRGGELMHEASLGNRFVYHESPYMTVKTLTAVELMSFAEKHGKKLEVAEQQTSNQIFAAMSKSNQDCIPSFTGKGEVDPASVEDISVIMGRAEPFPPLNTWLGGKQITDGAALGLEVSYLHDPPFFDTIINFEDGTRFRYQKGVTCMHFPLVPTSCHIGVLHLPGADKLFMVEGQVLNLQSICIYGDSFLDPPIPVASPGPGCGKCWGGVFEVGQNWAPLGKKVSQIAVTFFGELSAVGEAEEDENEPVEDTPPAVVEVKKVIEKVVDKVKDTLVPTPKLTGNYVSEAYGRIGEQFFDDYNPQWKKDNGKDVLREKDDPWIAEWEELCKKVEDKEGRELLEIEGELAEDEKKFAKWLNDNGFTKFFTDWRERQNEGDAAYSAALHLAQRDAVLGPPRDLSGEIQAWQESHGMSPDWHEPDNSNVSAKVSRTKYPSKVVITIRYKGGHKERAEELSLTLPELMAAATAPGFVSQSGQPEYPYKLIPEWVDFGNRYRGRVGSDWSGADDVFEVKVHGDHLDNAWGEALPFKSSTGKMSGEFVVEFREKGKSYGEGQNGDLFNLANLLAGAAARAEGK